MTIDSPRHLPKVDDLLRDENLIQAGESYGYIPVRQAIRSVLEEVRTHLLSEEGPQGGRHLTEQGLIEAILARLEAESKPGIRKVINATGAILHTNLGRAPLAQEALAAVKDCSQGYASLEFDIEANRRGQRCSSVENLLRRLFGVEAALVVNNNAAAVMLALSALCRGREILVSRGELVEIGGRFRVPEIMEESGAILCEVGTTNKTRASDYEEAIGPETAALMKVHRSNFRLSGFTEDVDEKTLTQLAHRHDLPLIYDLGSGCLSEDLAALLPDEPTLASAIASGADVVCFSGDKLLGGPQAGIIIGRSEPLATMRSHPLMRAFRSDKMTLVALEATLALYLDPPRARERIPLLSMALYDLDALYQRTSKAASELAEFGIPARVVESDMIMGGGSAPEKRLPSWALEIDPESQAHGLSANGLEASLRALDPPILCRTSHQALLFDLRTLSPEEERLLKFALADLFRQEETMP